MPHGAAADPLALALEFQLELKWCPPQREHRRLPRNQPGCRLDSGGGYNHGVLIGVEARPESADDQLEAEGVPTEPGPRERLELQRGGERRPAVELSQPPADPLPPPDFDGRDNGLLSPDLLLQLFGQPASRHHCPADQLSVPRQCWHGTLCQQRRPEQRAPVLCERRGGERVCWAQPGVGGLKEPSTFVTANRGGGCDQKLLQFGESSVAGRALRGRKVRGSYHHHYHRRSVSTLAVDLSQ